MKACLIFSPFSSLSYIPLGISYLKSSIKKNIPYVHVKNLDLSNNFYHNLDNKDFSNCLSYLCQICPENSKSRCKGILRKKEFSYWVKLALLSKSRIANSATNDFYNADKYNKLRESYDLFLEHIIFCINRLLMHSLESINQENNTILEDNLFKDDINKILSENPNIVGFSIFSDSQLYYSLALAKILKTKINSQIIFGGAYISHLDKKALLRMFNFIDFIIYKEGELGVSALLKNLKKRRFDKVPNLVYRKEGRIIENEESLIGDLDQIPFPDFSDYNLKGYFISRTVLSTLFSRGCFWGACTFCAHRKTYSNPYRRRSVSNLILELEYYQKKGIKHIWFADEMMRATDLDLINRALLKKKINMYYGVMLRPTGDFTYEILERMYRAGCRIVIWGAESFNQRILNLMNKGTSAQEIENVLKVSHKMGLSNMVYMIQGFPTQTEEEILKDEELLRKASKYIYSIVMHRFWLEADTVIFQNPKKFDLKSLKRNYLLRTERYKLFSPHISFMNKKRINWNKLDRLLNDDQRKYRALNEFNDRGLFYNKEHILLYLTR